MKSAPVFFASLAFAGARGTGERSSEPAPFPQEVEEAVVSFAGGFASAEAAAQRALDLIENGDPEALREIALEETEFHELVYPELPASRPERNTSADFVWSMLHQRSRNSLAFTLDRHRGEPLELVAVDFAGETTDYGPFRVHRQTTLTVRRPDGQQIVVQLFGSMIEQDGRFKIFSFVTD